MLPYTSGNRHPRSWGWVRGNGTALGMLADMLASGINAHLGGGQQAPTLVEEQVLTWLKEMMGMPASSSGLLTSGGTMANLLGLAVARHAKAGFDVREEGLQGNHPRLLVYCSTEAHMWARKSMEFLGLGHQSLRQIAVDEEYRISIPALAAQIAADRADWLSTDRRSRHGWHRKHGRGGRPGRAGGTLPRTGSVVPRGWRIRRVAEFVSALRAHAAWHAAGGFPRLRSA